MDSEVKEFLEENLQLTDVQLTKLIRHLNELGVNGLEDLHDVEKENLAPSDSGLKLNQRKILLQCIKEKVRHETAPTFHKDDGSVRDFLDYCQVPALLLDEVQLHLEETVGVESVTDLCEISRKDMQDSGLTCVEENRFFRYIAESLRSSPAPTSADRTPVHIPPQPAPSTARIKLRYIFCSNLFSEEVQEKVIGDLDPLYYTMDDLYGRIGVDEKLENHLTIEIYSHEGYPLNVNPVTSCFTLDKWMIKDNDFFYVFPRHKEQPGELRHQPLPPMDPAFGDDEVHIESQFYGAFTIKADLYTESVEDIAQKVSFKTKVPAPYMSLYSRRNQQMLDLHTEVVSGDKLTMLLRNPATAHIGSRTAEYGGKTYRMVVQQTHKGISKFYSILRFLCLKQKEVVNFTHLLAHVRRLTRCPPTVYALNVLYDKSHLSIPCWTALIEGIYQLFKRWLDIFCERVPDDEVFEFSDYLWVLLMKESQKSVDVIFEQTQQISLVCPISGIKINDPVTLPGNTDLFDRASVMEKIEVDEAITGCHLKEQDVKNAEPEFARLLLYNPWYTDREIHTLTNAPPAILEQAIPKLSELPQGCEWYSLAGNLNLLQIRAPDALFGTESLTFIEEGKLVLFMGFTKDTEVSHTIYDPLTCDYRKVKKTDMAAITSGDAPLQVFLDLTKRAKQKETMKLTSAELEKARAKPIVTGDEADWDPQEAIVVLLDVSGSMSSNIYNEKALSRLEVAKIFFGAFSLRTQAYGFHHSVGLTLFGSYVIERLKLERINQKFEHSLDGVSIHGSTSLQEAMAVGATQLSAYTKEYPSCKRRILCLTDGYEGGSARAYRDPYTVARLVREKGVIIDTVLIDTNAANVTQKAITHATGGTCFMPKSVTEGLQLFEMETFLSLRARAKKSLPALSESGFNELKNTSRYPFDEQPLGSCLFQDFKTQSIDMLLKKYTTEEVKEDVPVPCVKRVMNEISRFKQNPPPGIDVFPSEESILSWKVLMKGPEFTPYAGGHFLLTVTFSKDYPTHPPDIRFLTPIYHCNINSYGRVCHQVLTRSYTPSLSMKDILGCVYGLLMCPEPMDPLDSVKGLELHLALREEEKQEKEHGPFVAIKSPYKENAKACTEQHAKKRSYEEMKKELSGAL